MAFPAPAPEPGFGGKQAEAGQKAEGSQTDNAKKEPGIAHADLF
jgi:hypothetical protein